MSHEKKKRNDNTNYMEYQMLSSQYAKYQQQLQAISQQIMELSALENNLSDIKTLKGENQILIPFGSGILLKATLNNVDKLLVNVGSNTIVEKDLDQTKELIKIQIKELEQIQENYQKEISNIAVDLQIIQRELSSS